MSTSSALTISLPSKSILIPPVFVTPTIPLLPSFSTRLSPPTVLSTASPPISNPPVPGNEGGTPSENNNGFAPSASLYLYTFLATLVLLLGVSSTIVVRSFILRRRHRRQMDEAIRNGTWIPLAPTIPGPGRVRVDLSKKPKIHDLYYRGGLIGGQQKTEDTSTGSKTDVHLAQMCDWECIKPISAAYASFQIPVSNSSQNTPSSSRRDNRDATMTTTMSRLRFPGGPTQILRRLTNIIRPSPPLPPTHRTPSFASLPSSSAPNRNAGNIPDPSLNPSLSNLVLSPGTEPPMMRVAVLIAMPSASTSVLAASSRIHVHIPPSGSGNSHPSTSQENTPSTSNQTIPQRQEIPIPLVEIGVAQVPIVVPHMSPSSAENGDFSAHGHGRKSTGSETMEDEDVRGQRS